MFIVFKITNHYNGVNNGLVSFIPSGKRLHNELERSTMLSMGKSSISMVIFNSYVKLPEV